MPTPHAPFDVFLSYARADNHPPDPQQGWVTALHAFIQRAARLPGGVAPRVFFDTQDIRDYEDWRHRILEALRHSKVLLVCLSPAYFNSKNCRWEWEHFLRRQGPHVQGDAGGIQSVRFVELPGSLPAQNQEWLDSVRRANTIDLKPWFAQGPLVLQHEPAAQASAQRAVAALLARIRDARRELARQYGNLRAANEHFVGRRTQLRDLHERVGVGRVGVITAVHGLGGIGKTELAVQYANEYARSFPGGIWWINAARQRDLKLCLASLIDEPRFPQPATRSTDDATRYAEVIHALEQAAARRQAQDPDGGSQVLILLDNVDHPELLGANQRSLIGNLPWLSLLATTRQSASEWDRADRLQVLELDALDPDDALALFREWQPKHAFAHDDDEAAARELCTLLGNFTLAVEQAAIYCGTEAGVSLPGFVAALKTAGLHQLDTLAQNPELQASMQHREKQLALVLAQTLPAQGTLERLLLDYAACWGPDAIPKPWIEELVQEHDPQRLQTQQLGKNPLPAAWAWLQQRRLLTPAPQAELLRLHRLVRTHLGLAPADRRGLVEAQIDMKWQTLQRDMDRQPIPAWHIDALEAWVFVAHAAKTRLRASTLGVLSTYIGLARSVSAAASLANASLEDFQQLLAADPTSAEAQRDVSVSLEKVGDIKATQGDAQGALEAYLQSLVISKALARADPSSALAQRDLSVSLTKVGNIKAAQGDAQGALAVYQLSLSIAEALAKADLSNAQAQRDVSVSLNKVGDIKAAQGDAQGALAVYRRMLDITESLAKADPSNAQAQRDLSVSLNKVGNIKTALGDAQGALDAYQQDLAIAETLAKADPSSALAQRDLSISLNRVGDIKAAQGDTQGALAVYQQSLAIREALAKADPSSAQAQRDVAASLNKVGDIKAAQGDAPGALAVYQQSLSIAEALAKADPSSALAQRDLSVSLNKVGDIKAAQGDAPGALAVYQQSLSIAEALAKADPSSAKAQRDLMVSHAKLWQLASERDVQIKHAREIDRIFSQLEARGAHISPADRQGWQWFKQWLQDHAS